MSRHNLGPARDQQCALCGSRATNWHHRLNRSKGGPDDAFNLAPLCGSGTTGCHGWVTEHPREAEKVGMYIRGQMVRGVYMGPDESYRERYREDVA